MNHALTEYYKMTVTVKPSLETNKIQAEWNRKGNIKNKYVVSVNKMDLLNKKGKSKNSLTAVRFFFFYDWKLMSDLLLPLRIQKFINCGLWILLGSLFIYVLNMCYCCLQLKNNTKRMFQNADQSYFIGYTTVLHRNRIRLLMHPKHRSLILKFVAIMPPRKFLSCI